MFTLGALDHLSIISAQNHLYLLVAVYVLSMSSIPGQRCWIQSARAHEAKTPFAPLRVEEAPIRTCKSLGCHGNIAGDQDGRYCLNLSSAF